MKAMLFDAACYNVRRNCMNPDQSLTLVLPRPAFYLQGKGSLFLAWLTFVCTFSSPLQDQYWSALNLISNKTRCPASSPGVIATITQLCMFFSGQPLISPFEGFHLLLPCLDGSRDHSPPRALMTLQALHAANELMDQCIDPSAAV